MDRSERERKNEEFKKRTRRFGLSVFALYKKMEIGDAKFVYGKQLLRCSSSIGANYRSACRARSSADFLNKLKTVEEETDETLHWLEFLQEAEVIRQEDAEPLMKEGNEILSMVVASITTTRASMAKKSSVVKS